MVRLRLRVFLVLALVAALVVPATAIAKETSTTLTPGLWEGSVLLSGTLESGGVRADGTNWDSFTEVTASGTTFEALVNDKGEIVEGEMVVDIAWEKTDNGTAPVTGDSYRASSTHRLTGVLGMSGVASQIVASGTLTWDIQIFSKDGRVDEISGPRAQDVEWNFAASQADCTTINGGLIATSGNTLMATALTTQIIFDDDYESVHNLTSVFWGWPETDDPEVIADAVAEVSDAADRILDGVPDIDEVRQLVHAVEALRALLALLESCQLVPPNSIPASTHAWLAGIIRQALGVVLDLGDFTTQELITFLNIGVRADALDAALREWFGIALDQELDNAIAADDIDSIWDIAIAGAQYGYPDVYLRGVAAAEDLGSDSP